MGSVHASRPNELVAFDITGPSSLVDELMASHVPGERVCSRYGFRLRTGA